MLFTGSQLTLKRNFYTQTGNYGFVMDATVDNTSGVYHFGLSGAAGVLDFRLESGHMYWGNQFVHTYRSHEQFTIEAQFTSGTANVLKDNHPLVYGASKATGYFDYFYFTRADTNMGGEFEVQVSGNNAPVYSIIQQGYLASTGQNAVTGWFLNQGTFPIKIFDDTIQATANYSFGKLVNNVGAAGSGAFAYTGDYSTIDFSQPILTTFATNFGNAAVLFSIIDTRSFDYFVQLTAPTDFSFNASNVLNRDVSYLNFSGGVVSDGFNANLFFSLSYVSGSGSFTMLSPYSVPGLGRFNQSGYLTGYVPTPTGNILVSGTSWATGAATGFFSGMGTGIASGLGYTGLATGMMTGRATGFILDGSGILNLNYPLIGTGRTAVAIGSTGGAFAAGYLDITTLTDGDQFQIIYPDGNDYEFAPLAVLNCGYYPFAIPECNLGPGPGTPLVSFTNATQLIECISGYPDLGLNGVFGSGPGAVITFTALTMGPSGNAIAITGVTSTIVLPGSGYLAGGSDPILYIGSVAPVGQPYTGAFDITITGSGIYQAALTGLYYLPYTKSFTGSWDLLTGGSPTSLVSLRQPGNIMSGRGSFAPNSFLNMQVTYYPSGVTPDGALLIVSGDGVVNPIYQSLSLP